MEHEQKLKILYDGNCPLCRNRVAHLKRLDRQEKMTFTDFRNQDFDASGCPIPIEALEKQIHAITPEEKIVNQMEVIRVAYRTAGHGWIMAPTGWPLLRPLFNILYRFVAKNRMFFSRFFRD